MQEINTEISEEKNEPTVEVLGEELLPIEVSAVNEAVEAEEIEEVVQAEPLVFQIGVVFENTYPPEAAVWCNENNAFLSVQTEDGVKYFTITAIPPETTEEKSSRLRRQRNALLSDTDRVMLSDYPITTEEKTEYVAYRQYLRDIPAAENFPDMEILSFSDWQGEGK